MLPLNTNRLFIYPCRLPLLTQIFLEHPNARETLQANIPENWPQSDLKEQLPHFIELLQHDPRSFPWMLWIIVNKEEGTVIGDIGFKGRPDKNGVIEIGYTLLPSWRKKGYMREAATALVEWAFRQPHVKKLIAECDVTNTASMKVLQHLGMEEVKSPGEMLHWQLLNK
jgi:RimJ/RimL family protein N-acetyltransferase